MPLEMVQLLRRVRLPELSRNDDEREFLPAALEIIETPPSPAGRLVALTIIAAAVVALAWACIGKIDIIATAPGRVVPVGMTKIIQPMEIGTVTAIRVADGDAVRKGQLLIALDTTQAAADRDRFARDLNQAKLDLARYEGLWTALQKGNDAVLDAVPAGASASEVESARSAMKSQQDEEAAALGDLDQQIAEKKAEAAAAAESVARYEASLPLVQQQADLREKLMKMQFGNRLSYLQAEQTLVEQQGQIVVLRSQQNQALAEERALMQKRKETADDYEKTILDSLDKAQARVSELEANYIKARDTVAYKSLRAPIAGTVQELAVHTIGGVVTPAQQLVMIVPDNAGLVVEATVSNRDVGFVHAGQTAKVKVDAFNFTQYGLIDGKVLSLNRDTVEPPQDSRQSQKPDGEGPPAAPREPGYVARIALQRDWIETENGRMRLGPGMTVTAEINTGRRRMIDYLLSPLARKVDNSLHER